MPSLPCLQEALDRNPSRVLTILGFWDAKIVFVLSKSIVLRGVTCPWSAGVCAQHASAAKMQIASTVKLCFMNAPLSSTAGFNLLYQLGARHGNLLSTLQIFQRKRA